jgi:hypothetical protein
LDGGSVTTLASQVGPYSIAVDDTNVYWSQVDSYVYGVVPNSSVREVSLGGGTASTLALGQGWPSGIAVTGASVYWANEVDLTSGSSQTGLMTVPVDGGTPTTVAVVSTSAELSVNLAVDATSAYWMAVGGDAIIKVSLAGGAITTLASGQCPSAIAIDATSVYWTARCAISGSVMKVALDGGTVTTLAVQNPRLTQGGVAVDGTNVYWTSYDSRSGVGRVLEAPK